MNVLFYGRLAEMIGPELEIEVPSGCSIVQLRDRLIADHPQAARALGSERERARACVADAFVDGQYILQPSDRVEFLPPVSGG